MRLASDAPCPDITAVSRSLNAPRDDDLTAGRQEAADIHTFMSRHYLAIISTFYWFQPLVTHGNEVFHSIYADDTDASPWVKQQQQAKSHPARTVDNAAAAKAQLEFSPRLKHLRCPDTEPCGAPIDVCGFLHQKNPTVILPSRRTCTFKSMSHRTRAKMRHSSVQSAASC